MFAPTSCINTHIYMSVIIQCSWSSICRVVSDGCELFKSHFFLKARDFENFHKKDWKFCSYCAYIPCNRENCDLCTVKEQSLDLFVCLFVLYIVVQLHVKYCRSDDFLSIKCDVSDQRGWYTYLKLCLLSVFVSHYSNANLVI